ncbi:DUF1775 domain-containing protein [Yinghuangia soli]|uniref:DUF1775 domain-containing protein n=1 Tax=Yinghuangia soli TaxID=2908204 RepID=A0AA41TXR9_9ACTN|nr:DUF1775 domain-containing protein [Yinghuangia soli]MCF2525616.1 DUF1775 domain-containing protein [Yinghuangia soli]
MKRSSVLPAARRFAVAAVVAGAVALGTAAPAFAHNEVHASDARALATDVTLTFGAEAESKTAGITSLRVVLPPGITPADVSLAKAPKDWTYTPAADGFTVGGTALAVGTDAEYAIKVRQLPDASLLVFKTLQTYSDGRIDRWIDPPKGTEGADDHADAAAKPAPTLTLGKAAPGATPIPATPTAAPSSAAPATSAAPAPSAAASSAPAPVPTTTVTPGAAQSTDKDDDSSLALPATLGAIAVLLVLGGGFWWWRRRNAGADPRT